MHFVKWFSLDSDCHSDSEATCQSLEIASRTMATAAAEASGVCMGSAWFGGQWYVWDLVAALT